MWTRRVRWQQLAHPRGTWTGSGTLPRPRLRCPTVAARADGLQVLASARPAIACRQRIRRCPRELPQFSGTNPIKGDNSGVSRAMATAGASSSGKASPNNTTAATRPTRAINKIVSRRGDRSRGVVVGAALRVDGVFSSSHSTRIDVANGLSSPTKGSGVGSPVPSASLRSAVRPIGRPAEAEVEQTSAD